MTLPQIESLKIRLNGTRPLLMSRGEAANPFDPQSRALKGITQKKKKTDEDHELIARLQFESSLYYDEKIGPYLPVDNLWKCCQQGAARYKESPVVKSNVIIKGFVGKELDAGAAQLIFKGGKDLDSLYKEHRYLKMAKPPGQKTSILTSRAKFDEWAVEFQIEFTDITKERIMDYWRSAGRFVGIGTWRLVYGLFTPEIIK